MSADHVRAVNQPFLQVAVGRNFVRGDAFEFVLKFLCPGGIDAENFRRRNRISEKVANELLVVGDAVFHRSPFVRPALRGNERSRGHTFELLNVGFGIGGVKAFSVFAEFLEVVFPEVAGFLHHGISLLLEEFFVVRKLIMFPHMKRVPGVNRYVPHGPAAPSPRILRNARCPAAMVFAEFFFRHYARCGGGFRNVVQKRFVALGKVGDFRRPVGFLNVDVVVIIARPRRVDFVVPQPLKIRGKRVFGGRHQQVATELEEIFFEVRIVFRFRIIFDALRSRERRRFFVGRAEVDFASVKELSVGGDVFFPEHFRRDFLCGGNRSRGGFYGIGAFPIFLFAHQVVGVHRDENDEAVRVFNGNFREFCRIEMRA